MNRADSKSASSGWQWGAGPPSSLPPPHRPDPPRRGSLGAALAAILFLGILSLGAAAVVGAMPDDAETPDPTTPVPSLPTDAPAASSSSASRADAVDGVEARPVEGKSEAPATATPRDKIVWTTDAPSTLDDLARAWSIPRDVLTGLNPDLAAQGSIAAGTKVVVHSYTFPGSISVGSPNDGRLTNGVPLPEGDAWLMPVDRTRAFATLETVSALTTALETYGRRFPEADPIQIGDLSARKGGKLFGHDSHRTGRDVDIRLVRDASGEGFDAERNWFLVKTLVDGSDVTAIFLNAKEQTWLRAAAEADVGANAAAPYFSLIRHEPGHTIHMHVRFGCPKGSSSYRCVAYPVPDSGEQAPKTASKLPSLPTGKSKLPSKLPGTTPSKVPPSAPDKSAADNKKGKKKAKTKTLRPR